MPELGNYIRMLRKEKGLTQAALADLLHVTDKAVSKWERNLSWPDISLFPKLAEILGVSICDLVMLLDQDPASRLENYIDMSHDIRTPIHIILGCADLAEKYADDPERRQRYLKSIRVSGEYLLERCSQLSQYTSGSSLSAEDITEFFRKHSEEPETEAFDFSGRRILIAEDIELNREIAMEMIRYAGGETECAADGRECIDMLMKAPAGYYDLILMDVSMPDMDGIEAAERIRKLEDQAKADIPIIAMTANVDNIVRKAAYEAGMNGFTEKPFNVGQLYETITQFI